jgi:hypothetical protein
MNGSNRQVSKITKNELLQRMSCHGSTTRRCRACWRATRPSRWPPPRSSCSDGSYCRYTWRQVTILRLHNLQLQRWRCSSLSVFKGEGFFLFSKTHYSFCSVVTRDCKIRPRLGYETSQLGPALKSFSSSKIATLELVDLRICIYGCGLFFTQSSA